MDEFEQLPKSRSDLQSFVDAQVQESLHLDYKESRALTNEKGRSEVSKDASAFANSDGGLIIYGIKEKGHVPIEIDEGVSATDMSRERLEQLLLSNVSPRIPGLEIALIPMSSDGSAFVVRVPKSVWGPHQDRKTHKYYRRYNFNSIPMEDYEIADVRSRQLEADVLVRFDAEENKGFFFLVVENVGRSVASDVTFRFSPRLEWRGDLPPMLADGIPWFAPRQRFKFFYGSHIQVLAAGSKLAKSFDVELAYKHTGHDKLMIEKFKIDFSPYLGTWLHESEAMAASKKIGEAVGKLTTQLQAVERHLNQLAKLAGPSGLDIAVRTLRNIRHIRDGTDELEKLDPVSSGIEVFREALGVDIDLASRLDSHFWQSNTLRGIRELDGVDANLIEKIRRHFSVQEDDC